MSESTYGGGSTLGTWRIRQGRLARSASTEREMATNAGEGRKYLAAKGGQGSARGRIRQDSLCGTSKKFEYLGESETKNKTILTHWSVG